MPPGTLGTQYSNVLHPAFVNQFSAQSAVSSPHLTQCMLTDGCALSMTRALHASRSLHSTCTRYTLAQSPTWHCLSTTCTPSTIYDLHPPHNVYLPACLPALHTTCASRSAHPFNTSYTPNNVHFPVYTQDDLHTTQSPLSSQHSTRPTPQTMYTFHCTLRMTYTPHSVHFSVNTRQDLHPKHCALSSLRSGPLTPHTVCNFQSTPKHILLVK